VLELELEPEPLASLLTRPPRLPNPEGMMMMAMMMVMMKMGVGVGDGVGWVLGGE
jgi:hypothetical protein